MVTFVELDGIDAVGKSTQVALLARSLKETWAHADVVIEGEFSSCVIGDLIRDIISKKRFFSLSDASGPVADTFLLLADAMFKYESNSTASALNRIVVSDRGYISLIAYQTYRIAKVRDIADPSYIADALLDTVLSMMQAMKVDARPVLLTIREEELQKRVVQRGEQPLSLSSLQDLLQIQELQVRIAERRNVPIISADLGTIETVGRAILEKVAASNLP